MLRHEKRKSTNKTIREMVSLFIGVVLAGELIPGISYDNLTSLVLVALVLAVFNAFLKPVLILMALPFVIVTLGMGIWLINALFLYMGGYLVSGFAVSSFWAALFGAFIISIVNAVVGLAFGENKFTIKRSIHVGRSSSGSKPSGRKRKLSEDVIDV